MDWRVIFGTEFRMKNDNRVKKEAHHQTYFLELLSDFRSVTVDIFVDFQTFFASRRDDLARVEVHVSLPNFDAVQTTRSPSQSFHP